MRLLPRTKPKAFKTHNKAESYLPQNSGKDLSFSCAVSKQAVECAWNYEVFYGDVLENDSYRSRAREIGDKV